MAWTERAPFDGEWAFNAANRGPFDRLFFDSDIFDTDEAGVWTVRETPGDSWQERQ